MKNKKILITGATGFIGKNLTATLLQAGYTNLYLYDRMNTVAQLERYCADADFVFHLAGVNRPQDPKEFYEGNTDFSKIKVGLKTLDDAILELGDYKKLDTRYGSKDSVMRAIYECDYATMKEISNFYYKTSGIYSRLCRYMAYLFRYDWMITPFINSDNVKGDKVLNEFHRALLFLDNFEVKKVLGEIALKVIRNGCYYGYLIPTTDRVNIQDGAVLHTLHQKSVCEIGNDVSVGHNAIIHGAKVGNNVLVGMGAILMDNAVIPDNTVIAAGSVVLSNAVLEPGVYAGVPAKKVKEASEKIGEMAHTNAQGYLMYKEWFLDEENYK